MSEYTYDARLVFIYGEGSGRMVGWFINRTKGYVGNVFVCECEIQIVTMSYTGSGM